MTLQPDPREMYAFQDPTEDLARARKHELVREVKRLVDLTAHIDVERADRDELARLADDAASLADRLEPLPSLLEVGGMAAQQGPQGALLERSGISGRANPLAPPMQWHPDGEILRGWATYSPAYEGPIGNVHGGVRRPDGHGPDGVGYRRLHRDADSEDAAADTAEPPHRLRSRR
jgi:hypothetical protein